MSIKILLGLVTFNGCNRTSYLNTNSQLGDIIQLGQLDYLGCKWELGLGHQIWRYHIRWNRLDTNRWLSSEWCFGELFFSRSSLMRGIIGLLCIWVCWYFQWGCYLNISHLNLGYWLPQRHTLLWILSYLILYCLIPRQLGFLHRRR